MLIDQKVTAFLQTLGAGTAAPGGGSASALSGAMAASLAAMVAGLTINKKGYESVWEEMTGIQQQARELSLLLSELVDRDAAAFNEVMAAFKLPKGSDDEKATRSKAIQEATLHAARVPLETMQATQKASTLLLAVAERGNRNSETDVAVGALLAQAGCEGAYRNVEINLSSIKDKTAAEKLQTEAERLLAEVKATAEKIRQRFFG